MQQYYEKEQWLLVWLEEAAEVCHVECAAQKARREAEAKIKEEAERRRIAEKEEKKKTLEYIQWLWDKVIVENATFLENAEGSQVIGSKYKESASIDEEGHQPSKKAKGKYYRGNMVKIGDVNSYEWYVCARQDCLVYHSR